MGKTFAEKILAKKAGVKDVVPGQIVTVSPDVVMSHDNTAPIAKTFKKIGLAKVVRPEKLVIFLDHCVPAAGEQYAQNHKEVREFVAAQGVKHFYDMEVGICHQALPEKGHALPGRLILGSDSHTTTYGAFGAFAAGIGRSEAAALWATDKHLAPGALYPEGRDQGKAPGAGLGQGRGLEDHRGPGRGRGALPGR